MKKLVSRLPLPYQICLSVFAISILSVIQFATIDKTCLAECPCTVTVIVTDKDTGDPILQAIVKLKPAPPSTGETLVGITDDDGVVVFNGVEGGFYDIIADAQCYKQRKKTSVNVQKLSPLNGNETFTFKLPPVTDPTGGLSGTVEDGLTDDPISDATVKIEPYGPEVKTEVDGSYVFNGVDIPCVEVGSYKVSAEKDGYVRVEKSVDVEPGVPTTLNFTLVPAKIIGTVTDLDTQDPLPEVLVEALLDDTIADKDKTNNNGKYALNLNPGTDIITYIIRGTKEDYFPYESEEIPLGSGGEPFTHDFSLAFTPGSISGTVLDSDDDPVIGAEVTLVETAPIRSFDATTKTDIKGKYEFPNLEPGTYEVSLSEDACYANGALQSQQVELTSEEPQATADFSLTELTNQGMLAGRVRDSVTKDPVSGAMVGITKPVSQAQETTTDDNGIYRFDQCLTAGTNYTVKAEKEGYKTKTKKLEPAEEGENKLNFDLVVPTTTTTTSTTTTTTTTTTSSTTSTTITPGSTTTTRTTTTTTSTPPTTQCEPCEGEPASITFSWTCNSFSFAIGGESGSRTAPLIYTKDGRGRIISACGTVTYDDSENTYCVEINVTWGFFCISNVQGFAKRIAD